MEGMALLLGRSTGLDREVRDSVNEYTLWRKWCQRRNELFLLFSCMQVW